MIGVFFSILKLRHPHTLDAKLTLAMTERESTEKRRKKNKIDGQQQIGEGKILIITKTMQTVTCID